MALANTLQPFVWGAGGAKMTPEQIAREREIAEALMAQGVDTSPVGHWTQGAARMANVLAGKFKESRLNKAEAANTETNSGIASALLQGGVTGFPAAPSGAGGAPVAGGGVDRVPAGETPANWDNIRRGIFKGESGGDYDALFGFSNREGKQFGGTKLTNMTVDQALAFADPSGPYGQWVKGQVGRVATPMGAYQVVGTTLRAAKDGLGLKGDERMSPEMQDRIGKWILAKQGTGAWEGYKGPVAADIASAPPTAAPTQVASLDPSIGIATPATQPEGGGFQVDGPASTSDAGNRVVQALINPQSMTGGAPMPMQGGPQVAQAAPPLSAPQTVQDMPVAAAPQAPGPDLSQIPPMAGGTAGTVQPGQQGINPAIIEALSNPAASDQTRKIAGILLQQQMDAQQQASDPMRALDLQTKQAQLDQIRRGVPNANSSFGNLDAQARAAGLTPGTPGYQQFMLNGGGEPATFRALDLQAKAAGFQPGTQEYNEFMATRGAGLQAGAAQTAKNQADIATGGAAAGSVDLGKASIKAGTDAWESYGKIQANLGNINEAINAIDSGAKSGVVYKMLPNVTEASASLSNAMSRMGLDVVGSVTFGALSEGELNLAMNTAVPQDLGPAELKNWLVRKRDAQTKAAAMLADAAQYLTVPGNTINGWIERNRATKTQTAAPANTPPDDSVVDYKDFFGGK